MLLTSRRDERAWLGDLPTRVALPPMPMLERLELARAVASRQPGGRDQFLQVEDWRPLLAFTQGNPLTITILTRQALRGHHTSKDQIHAFVEQLRAGAATVTDDAAQGRGASLAASLDYGFTRAFTHDERATLALLSLFQGFTNIDALVSMGGPDMPGGPVPAIAGLDREAGIALLDRAAEVGLLTAYGGGYYAVHPAIPWHLHALFQQHYGPDGSPPALHATRAWTTATSQLSNYYHHQYGQGHTEVTGVLGAEEANLLHARRLALTHGWHDLIIGAMQGLRILYDHTGRTIEWRRLVAELVPELTDPDTGGPHPGREQEWALLTEYRVRIARAARDWPAAEQLQNARITWEREHAAAALAIPPGELDALQRNQIRNLAAALHELGEILREQDDPGCVQPYQEAIDLVQRIGDRYAEATVAFNLGHAYKDIPALRDLGQAEQWYQRYLELLDEHDTLGRAKVIGQLGNVAYERFNDARAAGAPSEQLLRHLNDAADAYHQKLGLLPDNAVASHAVTHHALGNVYGQTDDSATALGHFQRAIQYYERQDDRYGAGWARHDAASTLANAGRQHDALLYARAALRDYRRRRPRRRRPRRPGPPAHRPPRTGTSP